MVDKPNHSICDTDMLINLQLGDVFSNFLEKEKLIFISDSVKDELYFICNPLDKYKYLYDNLFGEDNQNIKVIYANDFSDIEQKMINATLEQYGMSTNVGTGEIEPNKGEFVTTLYAVYKNISIVRTCDKKFIDRYSNESGFDEISFRHLNDTLSEFLDNKVRIQINKIIEEKGKLFTISKNNSRKPIIDNKFFTIDDLVNKFDNLRLS